MQASMLRLLDYGLTVRLQAGDDSTVRLQAGDDLTVRLQAGDDLTVVELEWMPITAGGSVSKFVWQEGE